MRFHSWSFFRQNVSVGESSQVFIGWTLLSHSHLVCCGLLIAYTLYRQFAARTIAFARSPTAASGSLQGGPAILPFVARLRMDAADAFNATLKIFSNCSFAGPAPGR